MNDQYNFSVDIQIRMSDLDPFVHVNNGAQCHLFDFGRSRYLEHLNGDIIDWTTLDLVLVHLEMDFLHPILSHDRIACDTRIYEIGNKSMKMIQRLRDKKDGSIKTVCRSVLAGFDRITQQSLPIRKEYRDWINRFEKL